MVHSVSVWRVVRKDYSKNNNKHNEPDMFLDVSSVRHNITMYHIVLRSNESSNLIALYLLDIDMLRVSHLVTVKMLTSVSM